MTMSGLFDRFIVLLRPATIFHSISNIIQYPNFMNVTTSTAFISSYSLKCLPFSSSLHSQADPHKDKESVNESIHHVHSSPRRD